MSGVGFSGPGVEPAQLANGGTTTKSGAGVPHLPYMPGLDGLRAIAVMAVLVYHAGMPLPGGFLGVEIFFVLSGFLITALLLTEWHKNGHISLVGFWLRRARRLLPALLLLLAGTLLFAILRLPNDVAEVARDAGAALLYVMNWHLIRSGQSYFDPLLRPPLLQHLWSLAVEEQFYLVWPLLFVVGMSLLRERGMLIVTLLGAMASVALMAGLYQPGADPSRIYYGTDTRAAGVLFGAALAFIWTPGDRQAQISQRNALLLDGAGLLALCTLIACFALLPAHHPLLYRGGFVLVDVVSLIVLAALAHPGAQATQRLLRSVPLRAIGQRSYGIYLWHWPIFMVTRPMLDLPFDGLPLLALRLVILAILVEASYRFVEVPVRRGVLPHTRSMLAAMRGKRGRQRVLGISCFLFLIGGCITLNNTLRTSTTVRSSAVSSDPGPDVHPATPTVSQTTVTVAIITPTASSTARPQLAADESSASAGAVITPTSPPPLPTRPVPTATPAVPSLDPALVAALQQLLDETVVGGYVPGAVLSVSVPGHQPWNGASGRADAERDLTMEADTLVHLASVTKMFTAAVVLQLVEENRITLDAPIDTYLPGLLRFGQSTTVRHLLSHTTGIYDYQEDIRFFSEGYENPDSVFTPAELVARADQQALAFRPGTTGGWRYSSTNYVILGMLVEQITGRSLAQEMRERIFVPLDLQHTFFPPDEVVNGAVAQGYIGGSDRVDLSMSFVFATGNLVSTVDDLRRFADALFGGRLLEPESLAMMTTLLDTNGAFRMPELRYGLGVMGAQMSVGPGPDGQERPEDIRTVLGHIGGVGGFRSAVWWAPETGITIGLSVNQADIDPNVLARDVFDVLLTSQGR